MYCQATEKVCGFGFKFFWWFVCLLALDKVSLESSRYLSSTIEPSLTSNSDLSASAMMNAGLLSSLTRSFLILSQLQRPFYGTDFSRFQGCNK